MKNNTSNLEKEIILDDNGKVKIKEDDIVKAYKKLKSYVYYDNTSLFLRKKISEFENSENPNIETKLNNIFEKLSKSKDELEKYFNNLVHGINVRLLPKKVDSKNNSSNLITNVQDNSSYSVSKITYLIDMSIDAYILGVLWVMKVGYKLDGEISNNAYANRLKDEKQICENNINLFKPYYKQYEFWRDKAIKCAKQALENEKNTMIISLDIKDYYYSANVDFNDIKENLKEKNIIGDKLTLFVEKVFKKYSKNFEFKDIHSSKYSNQERIVIPIGFLPSNIIGNWYLREFDKGVVSNIHPSYYGRYVDDILLVIDYYDIGLKFTNDIILKKYFVDNKILECDNIYSKFLFDVLRNIYNRSRDDIIKTFQVLLNHKDCLKSQSLIYKLESKNLKNKIDEILKEHCDDEYKFISFIDNSIKKNYKDEIKKAIIEQVEIQDVYRLLYPSSDSNKDNRYKYLYIQQEKIKIYNLSYKGSTAVIDNFAKEIRKNSSEFRYLPEEETIINEFDEKAYSIGYSDSINKIRSVENIKVDKYGASKYLAKALFINKFTGTLINENVDLKEDVNIINIKKNLEKIYNQIISLFEGKYCIEFYALWEKVFTYFWINNKVDKIHKFVNNIYSCMRNVSILLDESQNFRYKKYNKRKFVKRKLQNDIFDHMKLSLAMSIALNNKFESLSYKNRILYNKKINMYATNFRKCNMERHNFIFMPLYNYCKIVDDNNKINFLKDSIGCSKLNNGENFIDDVCDFCNCSFELSERLKKYSPRYIHLSECILFFINKEIMKGKVVEGLEYIKDAYKIYNEVNFGNNYIKDNNIGSNRFYEIQTFNNYNNYESILKKNKHKLIDIFVELLIYVNKINNSNNVNEPKYIKEIIKFNDLLIIKYKIEMSKLYLDDDIKKYTRLILEKHLDFLVNLFISLIETMNEELFNINIYQEGLEDKLKYLKLAYDLDRFINKLNANKLNSNENIFINSKDVNINKLIVSKEIKNTIRIGIANIKIYTDDIKASYLKIPNISSKRLNTIAQILNSAKREKVDMLVFPEVSIPYYFLNMLADFSRRNDIAIICGLEHIVYNNNKACNYLATILPVKMKKYSSSIVKLRLKNHYSPLEIETLEGNGWTIPYNSEKYYDLFTWKGINFACYNCFELASVYDRAIFKSIVDIIVASVYNKDVEYFSNIVESVTRDVHCYFIQANSSDLGDSRISRPASKYRRDIMKLKGGINSTILVDDLNISSLRKFQIVDYTLQNKNGEFKPTPPEFKSKNVKKRMGLPLP